MALIPLLESDLRGGGIPVYINPDEISSVQYVDPKFAGAEIHMKNGDKYMVKELIHDVAQKVEAATRPPTLSNGQN
jgi:uncharacterized protein YlzI (FlbEa/FlbD family)